MFCLNIPYGRDFWDGQAAPEAVAPREPRTACGPPADIAYGVLMPIKKGDTVRAHYTGTLDDGTVFDSSREREPLEFELGKGMLIPGFEAAVEGREAGETVTVTIPPEEAYGEADEELIFTVPRAQVPDHIPLNVGVPLQLSNEQGQMDVTITEVGADEITLDANHPLAGKTLTFEIEIVSVN